MSVNTSIHQKIRQVLLVLNLPVVVAVWVGSTDRHENARNNLPSIFFSRDFVSPAVTEARIYFGLIVQPFMNNTPLHGDTTTAVAA